MLLNLFQLRLICRKYSACRHTGMDPRDIKKITEEDKVIILREQGRLERSLIEAENLTVRKFSLFSTILL